jgi:hypothetical protein
MVTENCLRRHHKQRVGVKRNEKFGVSLSIETGGGVVFKKQLLILLAVCVMRMR